MRWDDLELLRLIDGLEESETGALSSGFYLMERCGRGKQLDYTRDPALLARELLIARDAAYLTFDDQVGYGMRLADPRLDAHQWLQQIRDVRLTLDGRDRARGRVVLSPLPDPDQDDERPIAGMTLEEIARAIGATYTPSQLPTFLHDSGVPDAFIQAPVTGDKWGYVMSVLASLHDGGSAARRELRTFIGRWLSNQLHMPPSDKTRRRIVAQLGQQGWHVHEGVLVIGDRTPAEPGVLSPLNRDARVAALHATIRQVADRFLESGHMEVAIFEAFKAVNNRVKEVTGLNLDGYDLMGKAFRDDNPPIRLGDLTKESGRNIQAGFRLIFMGAVRGIRNPDAHELFEPLNEEEAFEELGLASMLMRHLDDAMLTPDST
jgi:uncharacterized protein (TIGR02391 family)